MKPSLFRASALAGAAFALVFACGPVGTGDGSASLTGTSSFLVRTAISSTPKSGTGLAFALTDYPSTCEELKVRGTIPYEKTSAFGVIAGSPPLSARTYPLSSDAGLQVVDGGVVVSLGAIGMKTSAGSTSAVSGNLVIDRVDDAGMAGSFDVTFPDGNTLGGTFDAPRCDGLQI